jgi:hypothetical protein
VNGLCQDEKQRIGETCDANDQVDCASNACGREIYAEGSPLICCPSNSRVFLLAFGILDYYCLGQPAGAACGGTNNLCASGACVNGLCQNGG